MKAAIINSLGKWQSGRVSDWAGEIRRLWGAGGANTLELAGVVHAARKGLDRGEWSELWRLGETPFGKRKGEMLVAIGAGLGWAKANTCAHLPRGWRILYYLARLPREALERLIEEGRVHPRLKLREAKALAGCGEGAGTVKGPKIMRRLHKLAEYVEASLGDWSARQRRLAVAKLRQITSQIENYANQGATARPKGAKVRLTCGEPETLVSGVPLPNRRNAHSNKCYEN